MEAVVYFPIYVFFSFYIVSEDADSTTYCKEPA